jgi:hypothetical protein
MTVWLDFSVKVSGFHRISRHVLSHHGSGAVVPQAGRRISNAQPVTPDGSRAWITFLNQDIIAVLDTLTNTIAFEINTVQQPVGMAFDLHR